LVGVVSDGVADGDVDGEVDGVDEGLVDGLELGLVDGVAEGDVDGEAEGVTEGLVDGLVDGVADGDVDGVTEELGVVDGDVDGLVELDGVAEGVDGFPDDVVGAGVVFTGRGDGLCAIPVARFVHSVRIPLPWKAASTFAVTLPSDNSTGVVRRRRICERPSPKSSM
jgi:hypothetical protein